MSSEASSLEELIPRGTNMSQFILGVATPSPWQDHQESGENQTPSERTLILDTLAQSMVVIEGSGDLEAMFREFSNKDGPLPASKVSIEAMPVVTVTEEGAECAICLVEYEVVGEAKEMPCKHRYHPGCIEKWLGIHGSCPVCRYKMPVEEESQKRSDSDEEAATRGRRVEGGIWVTLYVVGGADQRDSNTSPASESDNSNSSYSSPRDDGVAADGSSTQDMEIDNN